jgi:D-ribose pyranase
MKKTGILNSGLAKVVDDLGHTDTVCLGDLGLPVPEGVRKIDLSLRRGQPRLLDVLDIYLSDVVVEKVFLAKEMTAHNPRQLEALLTRLPKDVEVVYVSHDELKAMTRSVKAVVRTGEDTPFSNIILQSGVTI